jgi:hypothetical protein
MKMKKCLLLIALMSVSLGVQAGCEVPYAASGDVLAAISARGGWPISDEKCAFLNAEKLKLHVTANSTMLLDASIGWASVQLVDENNVVSDAEGAGTSINSSFASVDKADDLMRNAIEIAIDRLDFRLAAKQLKTYQLAANQDSKLLARNK